MNEQKPEAAAPQMSEIETETNLVRDESPDDFTVSSYAPSYTEPRYDTPGYDTVDFTTSEVTHEASAWDETTSEASWRPVETPAPLNQPARPSFEDTSGKINQLVADPYAQPSPAYGQPSADPYSQPSADPYGQSSANPYSQPINAPYGQPSAAQYGQPNAIPYGQPGVGPYSQPINAPYGQPSANPYSQPSANPYGAYGYGQPVPYGQNPNWNAGPTASGRSTISVNYWLSAFFTWIPALIFYLNEKDKNALMDDHLKEVLNFALTRVIITFVLMIPIIGWFLGLPAMLILFVISLIGAGSGPDAYSQGRPYRYPFNIRMIK